MLFCQRCSIASTMLVLLAAPVLDSANAADAPVQMEIYAAGEKDYAAFRIPAIVCTTKGTLLAFAEGRVNGRRQWQIDTVLKRSTDGGRTWSTLTVVGDIGTDAFCNPCPLVDRSNGRIWLPLIWKAGENHTIQNKRGRDAARWTCICCTATTMG